MKKKKFAEEKPIKSPSPKIASTAVDVLRANHKKRFGISGFEDKRSLAEAMFDFIDVLKKDCDSRKMSRQETLFDFIQLVCDNLRAENIRQGKPSIDISFIQKLANEEFGWKEKKALEHGHMGLTVISLIAEGCPKITARNAVAEWFGSNEKTVRDAYKSALNKGYTEEDSISLDSANQCLPKKPFPQAYPDAYAAYKKNVSRHQNRRQVRLTINGYEVNPARVISDLEIFMAERGIKIRSLREKVEFTHEN
jgi:hypothetical protein